MTSLTCPDPHQGAGPQATPPAQAAARKTAQRFAHLSRSHWSIENKDHWKKDSQWGDDTPRHRNVKVSQTLSLLRSALLAQVHEALPDLFARCQRSASAAFRIVKSALRHRQ